MAWTSSSRMIASGALITHQARFHQSRVVLIFVPAGGIALDVFADGYQFTLGTNNVFVIATLPDGMEVGVCPEPFRHTDLKPANDGTDRSRRRLWGRGGVYLGRGEFFFVPAEFGDHDNAMYVIWHGDEGIQFNQRKMARDVLPTTLGNLPCVVQMHLFVHHMAEQAFPVPCADRHKICPRLGGDGLVVGVGAILVIARIGPTAIVKANTRFAPTDGGGNGGGICRGL